MPGLYACCVCACWDAHPISAQHCVSTLSAPCSILRVSVHLYWTLQVHYAYCLKRHIRKSRRGRAPRAWRGTRRRNPPSPPLSAQEASPGLGCGGETISMFEITPLEKRLFLSIEEIPRTVLSARPFSFLVRFSPDRTGEVLHLTSE